MNKQFSIFETVEFSDQKEVVNVSKVPQRSPFRYPGGKTWLIPTVRQWLKQSKEGKAKLMVEPFTGGGIVSLTTAFENLADEVLMVELDQEVAAVWEVIVNGDLHWLADRIFTFDLTADNVRKELENPDKSLQDIAFCTILKNRVFHGGIIAKGSGMLKNGENGKGIASRWYPKTLKDRIEAIELVREKMKFRTGDAFAVMEEYQSDPDAYFFIDPPYTIAGKRLYTLFDIDHEELFRLTAKLKGKYMLTYDDTPEIRELSDKYGLLYRTIPMKTTHHLQKNEIIVSDNFSWW